MSTARASWLDRSHRLFERRTDDHDDAGLADHQALDPSEDTLQDARSAEREVRELLRQARVHVVQVRHAQQAREDDTDESAFLVGMDRVVLPGERAPERSERQQRVERNLGQRGADLDAATNGGTRAAKNPQPGMVTACPNGYVTRSTSWPSVVRARMRWNSLNGVPRASKNGSGAIIRMRTGCE
jgi:hypothetical protein